MVLWQDLRDRFIRIHEASEAGDKNRVDRYLASGGNVDRKDSYANTPLHMAAATGQVAVMEALLDAGADINAHNQWMDRPLHTAMAHNREPAMRLLIQKGASVDYRNTAGKLARDNTKHQELVRAFDEAVEARQGTQQATEAPPATVGESAGKPAAGATEAKTEVSASAGKAEGSGDYGAVGASG